MLYPIKISLSLAEEVVEIESELFTVATMHFCFRIKVGVCALTGVLGTDEIRPDHSTLRGPDHLYNAYVDRHLCCELRTNNSKVEIPHPGSRSKKEKQH